MKIVIVEDEPFAQQELRRLINSTGRDFELLATIDSVEDSIAWFSSNDHPDLVFLDIQLADGLSFEIFREISLKSAVIFTTAYDNYAIKAFELNSIDYLLKPIKLESLEGALEKFDRMKRDIGRAKQVVDSENLKELITMMASKNYKSRFVVKSGDQIMSVDISEIAYFKAEDNIVFLFKNDGHKYIIDQTLEQLERMLDPARFFRLNRTFIVAVESIKKVSKYFNSRLLIRLEPAVDEQVLVSRARAKEFINWLDQ